MLDRLAQIQNRIEQIEARLQHQGPPPDSGAFQHLMRQASASPVSLPPTTGVPGTVNPYMALNQISGVNPSLWSMAGGGVGQARVTPLIQHNGVSCGQTSVAMAINSVTGKNLQDWDIDSRYGFGLLSALNSECQEAGVTWDRVGELNSPAMWDLIERKVNVEGLPVIIGLNGPEFSPSGRGHIVTIIKVQGNTVTYADPADGTIKTTTKDSMNTCPPHPDGKFIFAGTRQTGGNYLASR
ncbi:MAG TPA: hypothetical protein VNO81_14150 [Candidatus Nitrosotenuis sp.]|jgi:hypothetical protein|nr:hypothetical protein [Candidatus Nitrosotenuis sp.]